MAHRKEISHFITHCQDLAESGFPRDQAEVHTPLVYMLDTLQRLPLPKIAYYRRFALPAAAQHDFGQRFALFQQIQGGTHPKGMAAKLAAQVKLR